MLTGDFYRSYRVAPSRLWTGLLGSIFGVNVALARGALRFEGLETLPRGPVIFATNSTHKNDFVALRWRLLRAGRTDRRGYVAMRGRVRRCASRSLRIFTEIPRHWTRFWRKSPALGSSAS